MKRSIVHVGAATFATLAIVLSGSASAFAAPAPTAAPAYIDGSTGSSTGSVQGLPAVARGFVCLLKTMSGGVGSICTV
ncbi:hypothetical protein ACFYO1_21015 [Nocardia sp. NPDC006044]|uniref:hypothetical protein n=1 Tax=Nocardia sp. NPDC006044 TaxID=3364306 RepID=UPI0036C4B07D